MPKRHGNDKFRDKMYKEGQTLATIFCASERDLARFWGVSEATVGRWKKRNKKFCELIEIAKQNSKQSLHSSLFRLANGLEERDSEGKFKGWKITPNLSALIFLLTNRYPDEWADKRAVVNNQIFNKVGENRSNGIELSKADREFQDRIRERFGRLLKEE